MLGLTLGNGPPAEIRQSTSVYGAFPESGCLGSERFCKFLSVGRPDGQSPASQVQNPGLSYPAVLPSSQWWRLLDVFRPSGSFVFVSEGFVSGDGAHDKPKDEHTGADEMLRQGHVMITSETSAFIPGGADF